MGLEAGTVALIGAALSAAGTGAGAYNQYKTAKDTERQALVGMNQQRLKQREIDERLNTEIGALEQSSPDDERQAMDEAAYFDFVRAKAADEESFLQEYMCVPSDDASAFISYELLDGAKYKPDVAWVLQDLAEAAGDEDTVRSISEAVQDLPARQYRKLEAALAAGDPAPMIAAIREVNERRQAQKKVGDKKRTSAPPVEKTRPPAMMGASSPSPSGKADDDAFDGFDFGT
jgi:hypothetical protein